MNNTRKNDIGLILVELTNSDKFANILQTAKYIANNMPFNQVCVFNSYSEIIDHYQVPILHLSQAKFFDGDLLVFNSAGLAVAQNCYKTDKIILYASDLMWQQDNLSYQEWRTINTDARIDIIAKTQEIYDLYEIMWKKPLGISEDFKYETIKRLI